MVGPWRGPEDVECAALEWLVWYNIRRLLEPLGDVATAGCEEQFYRIQTAHAELIALDHPSLPRKWSGSLADAA